MKFSVLGGSGAWPSAGQACSGYIVEQNEYRVLIDPGYGVAMLLSGMVPAYAIDAVLVSHGHPDHCADLNPLLRARALDDVTRDPLPVHALTGSLDKVLELDRAGMLDSAYSLRSFEAGERISVGPFAVKTRLLPHWLPNAGFRISAQGASITYTGDAGPSADLVELARATDLLVAEATYVDAVPGDSLGFLSSARDAGRQATDARASRLLLTHLWPGTDPLAAERSARSQFSGSVAVARPGMTMTVGEP